ncbi:MAG: helix-turn-helix domain-containing protein [Thiohalocapsa sp. PB-PSB1]|nr:MAG: hypothetical protein N838_10045 [Thiohalocapsa sp. PB-PSB1]QQO56831.1 MAG: helix-turn-helix domain-containing protein [Thiohalocapsa sp. PB-PSB1]
MSKAASPAAATADRALLPAWSDSCFQADRLLAFTRMPVAEAGRRLGCADPSHFSRRFRAARGESPGAYRARLHGETDASSAALRKFEDGLRS